MRFDSVAVSISVPTNCHITLGCSLVKSQRRLFEQTVVAEAPLHLFALSFTDGSILPVNHQLLCPGQTQWHEFNNGSQNIELKLRDVGEEDGRKTNLTLFLSGIILFECLG